jgi:hypothetical protein
LYRVEAAIKVSCKIADADGQASWVEASDWSNRAVHGRDIEPITFPTGKVQSSQDPFPFVHDNVPYRRQMPPPLM